MVSVYKNQEENHWSHFSKWSLVQQNSKRKGPVIFTSGDQEQQKQKWHRKQTERPHDPWETGKCQGGKCDPVTVFPKMFALLSYGHAFDL